MMTVAPSDAFAQRDVGIAHDAVNDRVRFRVGGGEYGIFFRGFVLAAFSLAYGAVFSASFSRRRISFISSWTFFRSARSEAISDGVS